MCVCVCVCVCVYVFVCVCMYHICTCICVYMHVHYTVTFEWIHFTAGVPSNFTVTADVTCSGPGSINIVVTPENSESTFTVTLTIEQLSSCGAVSDTLPGPQIRAG